VGLAVITRTTDFVKASLSEQDGLPSMSRLTAFLITLAVIGWVSYIVVHTGELPDLTSAGLFIAAGHGGYVANKVTEALGSSKE
jgi:hypothetical protein